MKNEHRMSLVKRRRRFVFILTVLIVMVYGSKGYGQDKACLNADRYNVFPVYLDRGMFNFAAFDNDNPPADTDTIITLRRAYYDAEAECVKFHKTVITEAFRFFRDGDDELYRRLESGTTISNAFIENLDFNRLVRIDTSVSKAFIAANIDIRKSVVAEVAAPEDPYDYYDVLDTVLNDEVIKPSFDSTVFLGKVVFRNSYLPMIDLVLNVFKDSVIFIRNFHSDDITLDNSTFERYLLLYQIGAMEFANRLPKDVFIKYFSIDSTYIDAMPAINIRDSAVKSHSYFYNSHPYRVFDFSGTSFRNNVSLNRFNMRGQVFNQYQGNDYLRMGSFLRNRPVLRNIDLSGARFWKRVNMENSVLINVNFDKTRFLDSLIFYHAVIDSSASLFTGQRSSFRRAFFQNENVFVVEPPDFRFRDYGFNFASIKQLQIPFVVTGDFTLDEHENAVEFYYNLAAETQVHFTRNEELRDELTRRWEHEKKITEIRYYRENIFSSFSNFVNYSWYSFLEAVVGNGYRGENRFFVTVLSFVFFFAIVYFLGFNREITALLSKLENEDPPPYIARKYNLVMLVKCMWVSFYVFITPKFAASFFHQKRAFFFWLLTEWMFGVMLIILFLVFIASNYSFVKALIGL